MRGLWRWVRRQALGRWHRFKHGRLAPYWCSWCDAPLIITTNEGHWCSECTWWDALPERWED